MNYYIALNGSQAGPFIESQIREKIASGEITGETLVWKEGMADWLPLGAVLPSLLAGPSTGNPAPGVPPVSGDWVLASLGSRFLAAVIDGIPILLIAVAFAVVMGVSRADKFEDLPGPAQLAVIGGGLGALVLLGVVQMYMLVKFSQTIGKRLCKIRIYDFKTGVPADWIHTIILRILANAAIGSIPCLGGLYSLVDIGFIFRSDRRCIHDLIAGTVVGTVPGE